MLLVYMVALQQSCIYIVQDKMQLHDFINVVLSSDLIIFITQTFITLYYTATQPNNSYVYNCHTGGFV